MTEELQKKYDAKKKRMEDAVALKKPDRVPIDISGGKFAINYAGYKMKDAIFDESFSIFLEANKKFLKDFDPDVTTPALGGYAGEGPAHVMTESNIMLIAGQDDPRIGDDTIQQFIEFPTLLEDGFDQFFSDRTKWAFNVFLPGISKVMEPFKNFSIDMTHKGIVSVADEFARPDIRAAIEKLWAISDKYKEVRKKGNAASKELMELGYPSFTAGIAIAPFDKYSDTFRGTLLSLEDLYMHDEEVKKYCDEFHAAQLNSIRAMNKDGSKDGKFVQMMLHKGIDGFMSDEHYATFYWPYLKEIIDTIIECNMTPCLFCEGKYETRLKYLADIPVGKVVYRFETMDMAKAKTMLGDKACLSGGFPTQLLIFGTKEQVVEETKRWLDVTMPGGGAIFRTSAGIDGGKVENVIAMFETVKEYGKY